MHKNRFKDRLKILYPDDPNGHSSYKNTFTKSSYIYYDGALQIHDSTIINPHTMLSDKELRAFVPTVKPAMAKSFYQNTLGLKLLSEDNFALEFDANGTILRVTIVPELKPHPFTVLGWHVPDIASTIKSLNKKGLVCEKYDFLEQDASGIWTAPGGTRVAWFKDPDGNLLSLSQ